MGQRIAGEYGDRHGPSRGDVSLFLPLFDRRPGSVVQWKPRRIDLKSSAGRPKGCAPSAERNEMETTTVQTELPIRLLAQMQSLVNDGWFQDINDLIVDALRRFLETRRPELMERYLREDVEWGLHGQE